MKNAFPPYKLGDLIRVPDSSQPHRGSGLQSQSSQLTGQNETNPHHVVMTTAHVKYNIPLPLSFSSPTPTPTFILLKIAHHVHPQAS